LLALPPILHRARRKPIAKRKGTTDKQTVSQTDTQAGKLRRIQSDRTDRQERRQADRHTERQIDTQTDTQTDRQAERQTVQTNRDIKTRQTDRQTERWTERAHLCLRPSGINVSPKVGLSQLST
jgi:hypothetical protein